MEILSEKTIKVVEMQVEFEDVEYFALYDYATVNIPEEILSGWLIGWAVEDLLRKHIDSHTKKPGITKRK